MHSAGTNSRTKSPLHICAVGPRFGSKKLAAGAPHIRAFCECVGVCAIRAALILAVLSALLLIAARPAQAQKENVLYNFTGGSDGGYPNSSLTFDAAGNFYGTTRGGGLFGYGTVFELSPNGSGGWNETVLYSFTGGADGSNPYSSNVIFDSVGNLYGTTYYGGANGDGVVFELSPVGTSWTETVLYSFAGYGPWSGVIMDPAGNLYGTTVGGAVFELSPSAGGWTYQAIYDNTADEIYAGLTMNAAGDIFGASLVTVFELSPNGSGGWNETVLYNFTNAKKDGYLADGTPVLDQAGNIYGTTAGGGAKNDGTVYRLSPGETGWTEQLLHSFNGSPKDGTTPWAGVVLDAAGNLYGTTEEGGSLYGGDLDGTVYELVAPVGTGSYKEKVLWSFNGADGAAPGDSLILDSAGNLYGTTQVGGSSSAGVVFEVTGLPKVKTKTTLTSSPNPSTYGEAVTFTAVVTPVPPDGETVTFEHGKTVLGTGSLSGGSASFTTSTLKVGTPAVEAVYGGDSKFAGSKSNVVKQVVENVAE